MKTKQALLAELQAGLAAGVLTEADIASLATPYAAHGSTPHVTSEKLSAVSIMFYIAGVILFSTIMSIISQSWDDGSAFVHVLLSAGIGLGLWSVAYYLIRSPLQNELRQGLTNALLLTGTLLNIVGGYIVTNELIGGYDEVNYMPIAVALIVLGGLHIGFDRLVKRDLVLLTGIILAVASFPAFMFGILQGADAPLDAWVAVMIVASGLLAYATRVVARLDTVRARIGAAFDSVAAFLALASIYVASFGDYGAVWLCTLVAAVLGIFYLSVLLQNRHLLGNGSFFMVITIITISFKYFSGYGVTFSLIVATLGLLASAAVASNINKKYFT